MREREKRMHIIDSPKCEWRGANQRVRIYINNKQRDRETERRKDKRQQTKRSWAAKKSIAMVTIWRNLFLVSRFSATTTTDDRKQQSDLGLLPDARMQRV